MLILENIRLALTSLKANKMRALLTMLGIIIGIASVIGIMTVGNSITETVNSNMASMGSSNLTVSIGRKSTGNNPFGFSDDENRVRAKDSDYYTPEMVIAYADAFPDTIRGISYSENVGNGTVALGDRVADISVTGASKDYFTANKKTILAGGMFTKAMMQNASQVCLISDKAAKGIYGDDVDLNRVIGDQVQITVNNKFYDYTIVGVYEYEANEMMSLFGMNSGTPVYIPVRTAMQMMHITTISRFDVIVDASTDAKDFTRKTERFLSRYYEKNANFEPLVFSMSSVMDSVNSMMNSITIAIAVIAGIALLVGGIGVMNIMLVSITERTREIGTRKALGAPNSSIRLQFIVEAIVICLIGGIIGVALGILLGYIGTHLMKSPCIISPSSIAISLGFSMAIGIFFGYYPANKAAKMDPIEALRYE